MKSKRTELSWNAVRRGKIYCAPACGGDCTWAEYQQASADAAALVKSLGKGWVARVWENIGWHYGATDSTGHLKVYPLDPCGLGYHAFLSESRDFPGGRWVGDGRTPQSAIKAVMRLAKRELNNIKSLVAVVEVSA